MAISIKQISISFPAIYRFTGQAYYPEQGMAIIQVETDQAIFNSAIKLTAEMRNKVFQADGVEGEFLYDLAQSIIAQLNPVEE